MLTRKLLLLSNSTQHGTDYLEYCSYMVRAFFMRFDVKKVLFVPYALKDHDSYARKAKAAFKKMGLEIESIHDKSNPVEAVKKAEGIFIGGGNTFKLLKTLYDLELIEAIRVRILKDGIPYMGASAGTNLATVTICTTNDMPIEYPPSFCALGLVPFNINPHYVEPDSNSTHMGETREQRIKEYHEIPGMPPVLGLREGCILVVEDNKIVLAGAKGAKLFVANQDSVEYEVGADISFLLEGQ